MQWVYHTSEFTPGSSAVLGNNYIAFYSVHFLTISIIIVSITSSLIVIINVVKVARRKGKHDFSVRFPIYIAFADALWGTSHLCDHLYLLITQTCPERNTVVIFTTFMVVWLGYQQCMHALLAAYMYLKICRNYVVDMGFLEWKLHLVCLSASGSIATIAYLYDAFGCVGFWMMQNVHSTSGTILEAIGCILCLLLVLTAGFSYFSIRNKFKAQRKSMAECGCQSIIGSSITRSLTTYVWISCYLYLPFVLSHLTAFFTKYFFNIIDITTVIVIVIVTNSFGWANALGYFYNQRMRAKRKQKIYGNASKPVDSSSSSGQSACETFTNNSTRLYGLRKPKSTIRPTSTARVIGMYVPTPTVKDLVIKDNKFIIQNGKIMRV